MPIAIFNVCYVKYKLDLVAYARYTDFLDAKDDVYLAKGVEVPEIKRRIVIFRNLQ
jgi:ATP-binding cassette subfamily B protein